MTSNVQIMSVSTSCGNRILYGLSCWYPNTYEDGGSWHKVVLGTQTKATLDKKLETILQFRKNMFAGLGKEFVYMFSDRDDFLGGLNLAEWIRQEDLGELTCIAGRNPNSGGKITTWLWRYNGKQPTKFSTDNWPKKAA